MLHKSGALPTETTGGGEEMTNVKITVKANTRGVRHLFTRLEEFLPLHRRWSRRGPTAHHITRVPLGGKTMSTTALNESLRKQISELLASNRVVLFMKGNRQMPQCGFSGQVVQILNKLLPSYETVDVLDSPELRDGIKELSQWPTIPQLYVGGQFIGGCDIVREMNASGELQSLIGADHGTAT